jgi:hypothetical protein
MRTSAMVPILALALPGLAAGEQLAPLARGTLAAVAAEPALYETQGSRHFFVHLRVENLTDRALGVRLSDRWRTIYPNQWGYSATKVRGTVDETRVVHPTLDAAGQAKLAADFATLTPIPAHGALDFYAEFNASGRAEVEAQRDTYPFLIVSLDGVLDVTDGRRVDQLRLVWEQGRNATTTDLVIPTPAPWRTIPTAAVVIHG